MGIKRNFNTLYVNGDSWSAGHMIKPSLAKKGIVDPNNPQNTEYRKKYAWPAYTASRIGMKLLNNSHAGASNDWIVRTTMNDINMLLEDNPPSKYFVIIGWSSPERKDFYYRNGEIQGWDTFYPAEYRHWEDRNDKIREDCYKSYVLRFWNEEEYFTRHMLNVINISNFLRQKKIKHRFFDAFYEDKSVAQSEHPSFYNFEDPSTALDRWYDKCLLKNVLAIDHTYKQYKKIYKTHYIKENFLGYLRSKHALNEDHFTKFVDGHPTKRGHQEWGEYICNLFDR